MIIVKRGVIQGPRLSRMQRHGHGWHNHTQGTQADDDGKVLYIRESNRTLSPLRLTLRHQCPTRISKLFRQWQQLPSSMPKRRSVMTSESGVAMVALQLLRELSCNVIMFAGGILRTLCAGFIGDFSLVVSSRWGTLKCQSGGHNSHFGSHPVAVGDAVRHQ